MITVADLIARLELYPQDLPVFWGEGPRPCWETKKNSTIFDFPMRTEVDFNNNQYLYFADFANVDEYKNSYYRIQYKFEDMNLLEHIKYWFNHRK